MDEVDIWNMALRPTAMRPFLGMTILAVEDSRYASDALRLISLRSGARIRRADCLSSARRHLAVYRPTVAVVDLGLPDGSGLELIEEIKGSKNQVTTVIAISGEAYAEDASLQAGAHGFIAKPLSSVAAFQAAVLAALPEGQRPRVPRPADVSEVVPDPLAYRDDMAHVASVLDQGGTAHELGYAAQFVRGVASSAGDAVLAKAATDWEAVRFKGLPDSAAMARVLALVQERLALRAAL